MTKKTNFPVMQNPPPPPKPKPAATLYDISREYSELEDLMNSLDGEISADDEKRIGKFLAGLDKDRDAKIENYCGLIKNIASRGEARDKEGKRLSKLARWDMNKVERLRWLLHQFMQTHKFGTINTLRFRVRLATNSAAPLLLEKKYEDNPELLPERFRTTKTVADTKAIKEALDAGEALDFAKYGEKGSHIIIE